MAQIRCDFSRVLENAGMTDERLQIRTDSEVKARLEQAALKKRLKLNDWALSVLQLEADKILDGEENREVLDAISEVDRDIDNLSDQVDGAKQAITDLTEMLKDWQDPNRVHEG